MRKRYEYTKDQTGQKLWFKAPEGRPSATPSVGIKDKGAVVIVASGTTAVTQDPVNTTLAATPSVGDKELQLTAVTNLRVGAEYRLTNTDTGQFEDVRILSTANNVLIGSPLKYAYSATATNNTFVSCEWYYTLQAADVDTLDELFVATSTYAVTGAVTAPLINNFDVVLHPLRNPLSVAAIKMAHPDLAPQEYDEQRGEFYQRQRDYAFDLVMQRIRQHGFRPAMITSDEDVFLWCLAEFRLLLEQGGISIVRGLGKDDAIAKLEEQVNTERSIALSTIQFYDADESESRGEGEKAPVRMDLVR
jgi:hypothetical protein